MKNKYVALVCALLFTPSCAALGTVTQIVTAVVDAMGIVDQIADWADRHFGSAPNHVQQTKVAAAIQKVRAALVVADRAAQSGESREQALAEFQLAYSELEALLRSLPGVDSMSLERFGASGEQLDDGLELVSKASGERLVVPPPVATE